MKENILDLVKKIAANFKHIYGHPEEQEQIAWWLLQTITKKTKAELLAKQEIELSKDQDHLLQKAINEHTKELKPLQYIIGFVPFANLKIFVEPPVLIPRPETEEWCIKLIEKLKKLKNKKIFILDLATGSGCIALALAKALPQAKVLATDISEFALELAQKNAKHNHIDNVSFVKSDIYRGITRADTFDLIVANPPYIAPDEWKTLSPMVRKWEDKKALVANQDGLALIREIIQFAPEFLKQNNEFIELHIPQLVIEIGHTQGPAVKKLMQDAGFTHVAIEKDLEGKDRLAVGGFW